MKTKRKRSKKTSKIVTVVRKVKNRYFYNKKVFRNVSGHIKKSKDKKKIDNQLKEDIYPNLRQISSTNQDKLLKQGQNVQNYMLPFLILDIDVPNITIPQTLQVTIHKGNKIDYTDNSLYYRISSKQVLSKFSQTKNTKQRTNPKDQLNLSVPQMQLSLQQYEIPCIVKKILKSVYKVNLWMYENDRQTQWHYDGHDNILYVFCGQKVVYLTRPLAIQSKNVFSLFNNHAELCKTDFNQQMVYRAVVTYGSCLFIPKGWWHKVYSYGTPSIAVNYWGNSVAQILTHLSKVEKSLILKDFIFSLSDSYCKRMLPNWQLMPEDQKQMIRKNAGHGLLELGRWQWQDKIKKEAEK